MFIFLMPKYVAHVITSIQRTLDKDENRLFLSRFVEKGKKGKREEVESLYKGTGVLCNKSLMINSGSVKNEGDVLGNYF